MQTNGGLLYHMAWTLLSRDTSFEGTLPMQFLLTHKKACSVHLHLHQLQGAIVSVTGHSSIMH